MKFSGKFLSLLVGALIIFCTTISAEAAKKVVAIMPIENVSGYTQANVAQIMTEQLISVIHNSKQYNVIETMQRGKVMKQQGFENLVTAQGVDFGNQTGSDYTVVGKVTMAATTQNAPKQTINRLFNQGGLLDTIVNSYVDSRKAKVEMDVRFVDNRTGEIVFAKTFSGSKSGQNDAMALSGACQEAAENFLKELQSLNPFIARVEDISGNEIYIDQGSESGLRKGESLIVVRETSPITVKGKIVGMKTNEVCKIKVTEVNAEYSICKADRANLIKKGDIVRRDTK